METDHYCAAPFVHLARHHDATIRPCCLWNQHAIPPDSPLADRSYASGEDPFSGVWMQRIRDAMLANQMPPACGACRQREATPGAGYRRWFNDNYGRPIEPRLQYLEFNLGNLCNMKCRMCSSNDSSKWRADEMTLGLKPHAARRASAGDFKPYADRIDSLKLIGGEPSMEQELIAEMLSMVRVARGSLEHLSVNLATNAGIRFNPQVIELLSQCKQVRLECSIDGVGPINDYIRTGSNWDIVCDNLLFYQDTLPANFILWTVTTWSILNAYHALDLLAFIASNLTRYQGHGQAVVDPKYLDIRNLPSGMKTELDMHLRRDTGIDELPWVRIAKPIILSRLSLTAEMPPDMVLGHITALDRVRGENVATVIPMLYEALSTGYPTSPLKHI